MHPKVSIIILHLENIRCLIDCIVSLNKITYENFDIFIVHNGPRSKVLEENLAPISQHITEVIDTGENVGFTRGNNIGIRQALQKGARYILLLNDDTIVSPAFLDVLVDAGEKNPDAGMLGPNIYLYTEPQKIWFAGVKFDEQTGIVSFPKAEKIVADELRKPEESDFITGCAVLVKKETIEKIGLLDERFFLYWEDVDWGLRAKKAGLKNLVVPDAHVWHKVSVSIGGADSPLKAYHKTLSHLLLAKLHAPWTLNRLHRGFFRDIAWLLLKATDPDRIKKAKAYFAAIIDYHLGKTGRGPHWLWTNN